MPIIAYCKNCNKKIKKKPSDIKENNFCSKKCSNTFNGKRKKKSIKRNCRICSKEIEVQKYLIEKGFGKFCSEKCAGIAKRKRFETACAHCNKPLNLRLYKFKYSKLHFCDQQCHGQYKSLYMKMENSPSWQGGISINNEYAIVKSPDHPFSNKNGYIRRARIIIENYIGRYLTKEEVPHHINEIKTDDRIENLYLFPSNSEHMRYHCNVKWSNCKKIKKSNLSNFKVS